MEGILCQCISALDIRVSMIQIKVVHESVNALENVMNENNERNKHLNRNIENEDFFLCDEDKPMTRQIGQVLNSAGGKGVMMLAFYVLSNKLRHEGKYTPGTMQMLDMAWDGIGEWQG